VILDAADADAFVLSSDTLGEFPDKFVVYDKRMLQHVIANGRVIVRDLIINESFANTACFHVELAAPRRGCRRHVETNQ
jgi:hypothetical protein